ncbi:MAG: efflux RND transporter periplasmic adaptor subunit [Woeseiaceae bacterium]|nr:efflux RND transporter periplasmic adaptor subunit [Woeseiaceae bacterium]MDX2608449.1 efflux RND transporter periplasmic adaptor subunit [Woeseiaceae bacterium]
MNTLQLSLLRRYSAMTLPALLLLATAQADDLTFETATVELDETPRERLLDGTVEAVNKATMSAQTAGRIAEVFFDVDDYVQPGQPIVRFTDVEQQAALGQAQAALAEARARQNQADEEFRRVAGLFEAESASKREYDQALAARDGAKARVESAGASVDAARQQLEYTLVRAPYAGIVTERHIETGEAVGVGQPLISGLSLEVLRVIVDLPQQVAAKVREYRKAYVLTDEGRVEATAVTIFPYAHSASKTFRVRLELPEGQFSLYPGMFVKVAFVTGASRRLLVPTTALLRRSEVTGVYVIDDEQHVRMRQVRVGGTFDQRTEVLAGLREGERVAANPVDADIYLKTRVVTDHD